MRTPEEFMKTILDFARKNENIRIVGMEGSRVNSNIPQDSFQDYDITYFVTDRESFIRDDRWISAFGRIIMMQKPEDMELFPAEEEGYSYLILFDDYINRINYHIVEEFCKRRGNYGRMAIFHVEKSYSLPDIIDCIAKYSIISD